MRVLIVEDDNALAETFSELCNTWRVECNIVHTVEKGLEALEKYKPHVLIIDLLLNGKMAIPIIEKAKKQENPPCLILCSAMRGADKIAKEYGTDYFLSKPFSLESIEEIIMKKLV